MPDCILKEPKSNLICDVNPKQMVSLLLHDYVFATEWVSDLKAVEKYWKALYINVNAICVTLDSIEQTLTHLSKQIIWAEIEQSN